MKKTGLRSRLTSYGDEGFAQYLRTAFLKSAGYDDGILDRPIVGIASTASDFNPCHATVPKLVEAVSRGVRDAGAVPFVFHTVSLHEAFIHPSTMILRNLMAMDTEELLKRQPIDAAVLIGGCDKTVPAQIMGAISADMPAVMLVVGPTVTGRFENERLGACSDCRRLWAAHRAGEIDDRQLADAHGRLVSSHGTCTIMGTASTMAAMAETLGLMLTGGTSIPAVHSERLRHAEAAGRRAAEMAIAGGPRPSEIVTAASLRNAATVLQALGGSTNCIVHLSAIAGRLGIPLDLAEVDRIGRETPVLIDVKPVGKNYMEDFHGAGGLPALMKRLGDRLDLAAPTVMGCTLGEALAGTPDWVDDRIIRPIADPIQAGEALCILRGSLAPDGAVIKRAAATDALMRHRGPAMVFDTIAVLMARIDDPDLPVTKDHVLVLRNAGPVGAPGMPEAGGIPIPKKLARAGVRDMVRISDARMSGTASGSIVLHVSPEAAVGGPLALVRDGDLIEMDVPARRLDLLVAADELARRRAAWTPAPRAARGYEKLYVDHVLQADRGCDFDFLQAESPPNPGQPA
ncbi:dihydroxy-acid dehydratase [Stella sp.]|uniref:dihydroxy-acid dehydratase n=1 Tax=Stella sp. TaxID=2912054 RepID=UPI0035B0695C